MKFHITVVCESAEELKAFTESIIVKERTEVIRKLDEQMRELQSKVRELERHSQELRQLQ
jgi:TolA-binding protein